MTTSRGIPLPYLRAWREWRGLLQDELAALSKVTQTTISRIERGAPARLDSIKKLAEALKITREELMRSEPTWQDTKKKKERAVA